MPKEPFKKRMPGEDRYDQGGENKQSFQYGSPEYVQTWNRNSVHKSPTDMSRSYKPQKKNTFFPRPK